MSAITAVFATTELLESILVLVDTKTLLLAQRVERRWHQVINNSKILQRKLFFLPTTTFDDILDLFLDVHNSAKFNILDSTSNRCKWLQQVVILNDILFDTTREWKLRNVSFANPHHQPPSHIEPSWKRMLLTQPPPSTGKGDVMFWFEDRHENDELCSEIDTMGQMMQRVYAKERTLPDFSVHWESAAVRPVKHAVDGTYYWRLLKQRKVEEEEEEELMEVTIFDSKGNVERGDSLGLPLAASSASFGEGSRGGGGGAESVVSAGPSSSSALNVCEGASGCKDVSGAGWDQRSLPCEAIGLVLDEQD